MLDRHIDDALHLVAAGAPLLLEQQSEEHVAVAASLLHRPNFRRGPGIRNLLTNYLPFCGTHDGSPTYALVRSGVFSIAACNARWNSM